MTQFDLIALSVLAVSGLIGLARGALRELATIVAFVAAAALALAALRYSGPLMRHGLHPAWIANVAALLAVFVISYIAIRLFGTSIARRVHDVHALGGLDRIAGLGLGLVRGFVILGAFQLLFTAATPRDRMPGWMSNAALYPAVSQSAAALKALEPQGLAIAGRLAPTLKQALGAGGNDDDAHSTPGRASPEAGEDPP